MKLLYSGLQERGGISKSGNHKLQLTYKKGERIMKFGIKLTTLTNDWYQKNNFHRKPISSGSFSKSNM